MEHEYEVTLKYKVKLSGEGTAIHLLDAVYQSHIGNVKGVTSVKPELQFEVEELEATYHHA